MSVPFCLQSACSFRVPLLHRSHQGRWHYNVSLKRSLLWDSRNTVTSEGWCSVLGSGPSSAANWLCELVFSFLHLLEPCSCFWEARTNNLHPFGQWLLNSGVSTGSHLPWPISGIDQIDHCLLKMVCLEVLWSFTFSSLPSPSQSLWQAPLV